MTKSNSAQPRGTPQPSTLPFLSFQKREEKREALNSEWNIDEDAGKKGSKTAGKTSSPHIINKTDVKASFSPPLSTITAVQLGVNTYGQALLRLFTFLSLLLIRIPVGTGETGSTLLHVSHLGQNFAVN